MKIKCPACGYENYFTGLEDEGAKFCSDCNKPLVEPKIPEATEKPNYANLGLHKEAMEACKKAICIDPDDADIYYNLGNTYNSLGLYFSSRVLLSHIFFNCETTYQISPWDRESLWRKFNGKVGYE
jgi:tetratricopeptide (TPR) repeat protein